MDSRSKLKICFIGGNQAGIIGALALLAKGHKILSVVSYSKNLTNILNLFRIRLYKSVNEKNFINDLKQSDLLFSVHGKEIVKPSLLKLPRYGGINIHPYLYKYKGKNPIERALKYKNFKASVGAHAMINKIDQGKVLVERFVDVSEAKSVQEIYNQLYPYYCLIILEALKLLMRGKNEKQFFKQI